MEFNFYSPEEIIHHPITKEFGVEISVKRDDLIHPFISGNKWRKLKYLLIAASRENKTHLITFGGAFSNHLIATACAAAKFGFRSTGFVRGEEVDNPVLSLCAAFGMKLIFVSRDEYKYKVELYEKVKTNDTFFIDEGGYSEEAAEGCAEIPFELQHEYQHVFCAAGTGATAAGLIKGFATRDPQTIVDVVPVLKGAMFLKESIDHLSKSSAPYNFHNEYHFGGYAKHNQQLLQFIKSFATTTGILLDQVYTGKMMFALFDKVQKRTFKPGTKVLAIHTGGLLGLLGLPKNQTFAK